MDDIKLQNFQITDCTGYIHTFKTLGSFSDFCIAEQNFWGSRRTDLGDQSHDFFINGYTIFEQISNHIKASESSNQQESHQISQNLSQFVSQLRLATHWLWSAHPFTLAVINCYKQFGRDAVSGFIQVIKERSNLSKIQKVGVNSNLPFVFGMLKACGFIEAASDNPNWNESAKNSLDTLVQQYSVTRDTLFKETLEHNKTLQSQIDKYTNETNQQRTNHQENFESKMVEWTNKIKELEHTYQEKLRLEKPAEYWKNAADSFESQGGCLLFSIVVLVFIGVVGFGCLFYIWSNGSMTEKIPGLQSIQGIVLFTALAATYAFILRIIARLIFSSYHLMRDAQEREQLVYLYLSLSNQPETQLDEKSREIVLQALFSRSETGLLANESGPTMPGLDIVQTVIKK